MCKWLPLNFVIIEMLNTETLLRFPVSEGKCRSCDKRECRGDFLFNLLQLGINEWEINILTVPRRS
jgi:hypothetical protein